MQMADEPGASLSTVTEAMCLLCEEGLVSLFSCMSRSYVCVVNGGGQ